VFSPAPAEIEQARKIILAHEQAQKEGKGVVLVDGKLVENLHVENAKRLVGTAEAIERIQKR
jgi:citrate lyase subunit beta/citryl-CoA lyase